MRVGIDLIEIARIEKACARWGHRFLARIYTDREVAACGSRKSSLASRFAAKEATAKALGVGIGALSWKDIEIISQGNGQPELVLHGRALARARELGIHGMAVSLSDTQQHAIAIVVML